MEPGKLKIYDVLSNMHNTEDKFNKTFHISHLSSDEFTLTKAVMSKSKPKKKINLKMDKRMSMVGLDLGEAELDVESTTYSVMNAFCMNWPYIAYSGLQNELTILNTFDQDVVHRIPIVPNNIEINICTTYITETRDLFILAFKYHQRKYYIYMLDLDMTNIMELKCKNISDIVDAEKHMNF